MICYTVNICKLLLCYAGLFPSFFLDFCIAVGGWPIWVEGERERKGKRLKNDYKMVIVILFTFPSSSFSSFYLEFWKVGTLVLFKSDLAVIVQKTLTLSICATLKEKEKEKNYGRRNQSSGW